MARSAGEELISMRAGSHSRRWFRAALALVCLLAVTAPVSGASQNSGPGNRRDFEKLDAELKARSGRLLGTTRLIVTFRDGADIPREVRRLGGRFGRNLRLVNGAVVELPNSMLRRLAAHSDVISLHFDRPTSGQMSRVGTTVGSRYVQQELGFTGAGIGVAVIDSGIASWHNDLGKTSPTSLFSSVTSQRVTARVNFVEGTTAYDENGHGTHVAGIIAGNGYETFGARAGVAPQAHLVSLKVLDANGMGVISDVIAAFEWALQNRVAHNIRVVNLSVGARVTESYTTDPLTRAAKRLVDAGVVVVAAAGNMGRNADGQPLYGAIAAPGNAPWVLTVGAHSTEGTVWRSDDTMAPYSSRGPTAVDYLAKPDLVAPGTGVVSLAGANTTYFLTKTSALLNGSRWGADRTYLSLTGTSMAAPVVSGTVALMMQANPGLTPNLVKAILQYTAERKSYDVLSQGAGFLNSYGAVTLARFFATAPATATVPSSSSWSRQIIWGNRRLSGGMLVPGANAWASDVVWGAAARDSGENIVWGTICGNSCENIVWGTIRDVENIVWGTAYNAENIVWGTARDGENIVWGTARDVENIVWGTACGGSDCENIVWGTAMDVENIVWGTAFSVENIVWGTARDVENIVWGTSNDVYALNGEDAPLFDDPLADPVSYDGVPLELMFPDDPPATESTSGGSTSGSTEGGL
ncbi:MAG TPA: S8 family serine peptidase [Vicinamibacterales bacterium]|nr:S8 family serine peptidase [Vicinamibacterales bacterium]